MSIFHESDLLISRRVLVEYFFWRLCRIDFSMIGLMSVSMISSWRFRNLPAMKREASTFSWASCSLASNVLSSSSAVDSVIIGVVCSSM